MTKVSEDMMWSSGVSFRMHHLLALRRRFAMNCSRRTNAPTIESMCTLSCIRFPLFPTPAGEHVDSVVRLPAMGSVCTVNMTAAKNLRKRLTELVL